MIILLRGNSASGKSSTAKLLRDKVHERSSTRKIALIEQDYLRRTILKEKETAGTDNIDLIAQTVRYTLAHGYTVILEGIFYSERYSKMLGQLLSESTDNYVYYFDISLEETLRRHRTKSNVHEYGETEMRGWFHPHDVLGTAGEIVLGENLSQEQIVDRILRDTELL